MKRTKATPAGASGTIDQAGAPPLEVTEEKGDLLIRDLWQNGTDSVHGMCVVNTDAKSLMAKATEKCLQEPERWEEVYLPGGMPPAAPVLLPLCHLSGWTAGGGGDGNLEEVSQSPGHKVEVTLLEDVWIRQE